jgi:hypothetical protein
VEGFNSVFSNNPELKEKDIKYIDDFEGVNLENKCVKHFKADRIYFLDLKSKLLKINVELDDRSLKVTKFMSFVTKSVIYDRA